MLCTRIVVLVLSIVFTACGVCAALFPVMRRKGVLVSNHTAEADIYLWYRESKYSDNNTRVSIRTYHNSDTCNTYKAVSLIGASTDVIACSFGGIVCLLAAAHISALKKFTICCSIMVVCFCAFVFFAVCVAMVLYTFLAKSCVNNGTTRVPAFHDDGYKLVEGFGTLCVATAGFLITFVVEMFS